MEYAGRAEKDDESDAFSEAVARYLERRRALGSDWVYAFESRDKEACVETYPQLYELAQAMYAFSKEVKALKSVAQTDGPDAWPDPKKVLPPVRREPWTEV